MSAKTILLLRLIPFFVGFGGFYALASSVASASRPSKFVVVAVGVWFMGYAFTWFNIYLNGKSGLLRSARTAREKALGHVLVFAGAMAAGYGFSFNSKLAFLVAVACLWISDDKLSPRIHRPPARGKASQ